ncbi:MAG: HAMP domain-containing histidine kinase [Flavobacteriaceae bacterium]|nr:HAMP domain-containing histidine kinase [Flavobacteriaceae bacterium]
MNSKKYRWLLYAITLTIVATIAVQVYWNYNNYLQNKQRVSNEIQLSLDNAIEEYFASLIKKDFNTIIKTETITQDSTYTTDKKIFRKKTSSNNKDTAIRIIKRSTENKNHNHTLPRFLSDIEILKKGTSDSIKLIDNLKTIYISVSHDAINYKKLDSLVKNQLKTRNINKAYKGIVHSKNGLNVFNSAIKFEWSKDSVLTDSIPKKISFKWSDNTSDNFEKFDLKNVRFDWKNVSSKSTFLKDNEQFKLLYSDTSFEALKRSSTGILLSLILSLAIISCLFYLLRIINQQKQLAEIKNDLISNITHEFKTPIATVSTAIEAIENFNAIDNKEKTKKYLSISNTQLKKLHQMVEKLLETATLDSEKLLLQKEKINVVQLTKKASLKDEFLTTKKNIQFNASKEIIIANVDPFHFENAISNLVDNAIKYGGETIEIQISTLLNNLEITVADNGKEIEKNQREKIFDKFYRVPKGNTHNVKGFGIGLYYTKKIIEKHGGEIRLIPSTTNTIFKITLPKIV